jgi:hypothetical protein
VLRRARAAACHGPRLRKAHPPYLAFGAGYESYEAFTRAFSERVGTNVIGHWFPKSCYQLAPEPVVEHYLDTPVETPPDELRTEVRVRIAD